MKFGLFGKNVAADAVGTVAGVGAQLALLVYLAHHLPTAAYAAYIVANAAVAVGEMFSDFGTRMWAIRQYALGAGLRTPLKPILLTKCAYTLVFGLLLGAFNSGALSRLDLALVVLISFLQPSSDPVLWFFRGREQLYKDAAVTLLWRLLSAGLMLALAALQSSVTFVLAGWLLASAVRVGGEWLLAPRLADLSAADAAADAAAARIAVRYLIGAVFPIGCAFVLMSVYQRVGVFTLQRMAGDVSVATYGSALSLVGVSGFLAVSISTAFFPRISRFLHHGDAVGATRTIRIGLQLIAAAFLVVGIAGVGIAPWVFDALVPAELRDGAIVMQILMPGLYISSLSVLLKYCLNALSLNVQDAAATTLGIVVFLATAALGRWGIPAHGAAIAWNAGELAIFGARICAIWWNGRIGIRAPLVLASGYLGLVALSLLVAQFVGPLHEKYPLARILHS